ncbi:MAG: hypothetical protein DRQ59_10560 [Gammaproteobacteria bacterium]|nr:MAG: hypothetical protein DRQ59_10560 [Gammaproteobacteria bacterium]
MVASITRKHRRRKTHYIKVSLLLLAAIVIFGWLLNTWMTEKLTIPISETTAEHSSNRSLDQLFTEAVRHMQHREYERAIPLWHSVMLINPSIPEVKVNMGFSLYEMERFTVARDYFISAMEQDAFQANAYYGLAITSEKMGDLQGAMGAMRSYIHLAANDEDERFVRKARAALWEWESQLLSKSAEQESAVSNTKPGQ